MNAKTSLFVICTEAIIYLLLYDLHDCTFSTLRKRECFSLLKESLNENTTVSISPAENSFDYHKSQLIEEFRNLKNVFFTEVKALKKTHYNLILRIPKQITQNDYRISSNKRRASNKRRPLISAAPLGIHIEISASL